MTWEQCTASEHVRHSWAENASTWSEFIFITINPQEILTDNFKFQINIAEIK